MLKLYSSLAAILLFGFSLQATDHTIVTAGQTYSPASLDVQIGDNVTIVASGSHPTTQVSEATWNANGTTPLSGGFGTHTTSFTFEITTVDAIFYVCDNHVGNGMKGQINVLVSSVDDLSQNLEVSFANIPVSNDVLSYTIEHGIENLSTIEVLSLTGQQVAIQAVSSSKGQLGLRTSSGTYIVIIRDRDGKALLSRTIAVQ